MRSDKLLSGFLPACFGVRFCRVVLGCQFTLWAIRPCNQYCNFFRVCSIVYVIAVALPLPLQYCVCYCCCHAVTVVVLCMLLLLHCRYRYSIVYAVQDQELHKQLLSGAILVHFVPVWVTRLVSAAPRCSYSMCLLAAESSSTAGLLLLTLYHYAMILVTLCSIVWK